MQPAYLFQADQPDLAAQLAGIADYLLPSVAGLEEITAVLGVRPLSQAITLQITTAKNATADKEIQKRITSRRALIDRLLQTETRPDPVTTFLDKLRVVKTTQIHIQYRLTIGDKTLRTPPEAVAVKLDSRANVLYMSADFSWTAVARELALSIKPGQPVGGLAMGIREVLTAVTPAAAAQTLDELGYA
jgi:hypothetical protein